YPPPPPLHSFPPRRSSDLPAPDIPDKPRTRKDSPHRPPALRPGRPGGGSSSRPSPGEPKRQRAEFHLFTQRGESMNSLLLVVLRSEEHTSELQSRVELVCR